LVELLLVGNLELVEPSMCFASRSIACIHHGRQTMNLGPMFVRMEAYMDNLAFSYMCACLVRRIRQRILLVFDLRTNRRNFLDLVGIEQVLFAKHDKPYYIGMDKVVAFRLHIHQQLRW
jgi:hypothetical protein